MELKKYKLGEIVKLHTITISPNSGTIYKLYSLPSFDNGMQCEIVDGNYIQSNKFSVPNKCILFNKLNVRFKRVWKINNVDTNKLCSTEFLPLIVDENIVDYQYLYYLLISDGITNYLCGQNTNTSGSHKRIDPNDFLGINVLLPSKSTQKQIGKLFSDIDNKINLNHALNQNLEAIAKQLYDYWFVQFDFPDENGRPYKSSGGKMDWNEALKREIPKTWEITKIGSILDKVINTSRLNTKEYLPYGKYPIIDQTTDIYYAGFTNREEAVLKQYPAVVFGDHSCAVKYVNIPFVRGADGTQILLSKNTNISVEYLYFVIKDIKISKGYARHFSFLKDQHIIIPSEETSNNFELIVKNIFEKINKNREENLLLTKRRDELLPLLMNGQVSVNSDLSDD